MDNFNNFSRGCFCNNVKQINEMCAVKYTKNKYEWITKSDQDTEE